MTQRMPVVRGSGTAKRLMDLVLSMAALVLLFPIMLLAALAVAWETGVPVLFRQVRVGLGGRHFEMLKFRSMVLDASRIGPHFTNNNDVRVTRVGRFIRRTSIDELPQIINVLKGEMSLVGPRPDLPVQRDLYTEAEWIERCRVLPGLTGLAQVELRSEGTVADRLALDLRYVREQSLRLDLLVLWRTFGRLSGKGGN